MAGKGKSPRDNEGKAHEAKESKSFERGEDRPTKAVTRKGGRK